MLIPRKPKFDLVDPPPDAENPDHWHVKISKGKFKDTIFWFDTLKDNEEDSTLHYSFKIYESPIENLTTENKELRKTVSNILAVILEMEYKRLYGNAESGTPDS